MKLPSHDQTVSITIPRKLDVCHEPSGKTLNVAREAVLAHLAHGDTIGSCG